MGTSTAKCNAYNAKVELWIREINGCFPKTIDSLCARDVMYYYDTCLTIDCNLGKITYNRPMGYLKLFPKQELVDEYNTLSELRNLTSEYIEYKELPDEPRFMHIDKSIGRIELSCLFDSFLKHLDNQIDLLHNTPNYVYLEESDIHNINNIRKFIFLSSYNIQSAISFRSIHGYFIRQQYKNHIKRRCNNSLNKIH